MTATAETTAPSLFARIGGTEGVRAVVERFYDLMQDDPRYAALRAMHAEDLFPVRVSLTQFLSAWLGGPRDWFEARPGTCIMSMHRAMGITAETAAQWVEAMSRAMAEARVEKALGTQMQQAFLRMAGAMMQV
ncbi:hemoglobin [Sphingomonas sp. BE270]|jgi:hemoglobin|uniref:group II truncated hemoglobin n=1 Tax=unclassified Sphingomonas TaxID=196159 RepID=UPI00053D62CE|nr:MULTISPECIES: group II truncated hemoglobin [unclassified Sphingomonas]MDR6847377.1 hemoglobin [Sphingomonas sp. BE137]MDR7256921.1 hemoglobin [Sphingomonas sp. BE270]